MQTMRRARVVYCHIVKGLEPTIKFKHLTLASLLRRIARMPLAPGQVLDAFPVRQHESTAVRSNSTPSS